MKPLRVMVITYAPTVFRHCQHCEVAFEGMGLGERIHRAEARDALPADLALEFQGVSDWVHALIERHGPRLAIDVVDAASIEGFWRSLRHGGSTGAAAKRFRYSSSSSTVTSSPAAMSALRRTSALTGSR